MGNVVGGIATPTYMLFHPNTNQCRLRMEQDNLDTMLRRAERENFTANLSGNYAVAEELARKLIEQTDSQSSINARAHLIIAEIELRQARTDSAMHITQSAQALCDEMGYEESKAYCLRMMGRILEVRGEFDASLAAFFAALAIFEKLNHREGYAYIKANIGAVKKDKGEFSEAMRFTNEALEIHKEMQAEGMIALDMCNLGIVYNNIGLYSKAIDCYTTALQYSERLGYTVGVAAVTGNIGSIFVKLGLLENALEYFSAALKMQRELGSQQRIALFIGNIGGVQYELGNYTTSLAHFSESLEINRKIDSKAGIAYDLGNMGSVYLKLGDHHKALDCYTQALALHEELGQKAAAATVLAAIGGLYGDVTFENHDAIKAEEYLTLALDGSLKLGRKKSASEQHRELSAVFEQIGRTPEALEHFKKFYTLEKEVDSENAKAAAEKLAWERADAEREKQHAIERERALVTDSILANILPPSITDRLIGGEKKIAETHAEVTILFVDIVGFTTMSRGMSAIDLIDVLDSIFSRFDKICKKHGLEKIKTIGDAYMAVAGAPVYSEHHAQSAAAAALEMLEGTEVHLQSTGPISVSFRIGLHSGSVVAGIIGENKYSYDLWGDTVNTASRMESHGEKDCIHVSDSFAQLLTKKQSTDFHLVERGEMNIRGIGLMKTFFLKRAVRKPE